MLLHTLRTLGIIDDVSGLCNSNNQKETKDLLVALCDKGMLNKLRV